LKNKLTNNKTQPPLIINASFSEPDPFEGFWGNLDDEKHKHLLGSGWINTPVMAIVGPHCPPAYSPRHAGPALVGTSWD
jgi:hypothetical protein